MKKERKKQIAAFRFQVIADLVGGVRLSPGELQKLIIEKSNRRWNIPYSENQSISPSTIRRWVKVYQEKKGDLKALFPKDRGDSGLSRAIDPETGAALLQLRAQFPEMGVPSLLVEMEKRQLIRHSDDLKFSTVYRFLHQNGVLKKSAEKVDRRRFEAEYPNDLWQTDVMHGPKVLVGKRLQKTYLIALMDDHSRLIVYAEFYLDEGIKSFLNALKAAFLKRGLPRKLYTDNGSAFRAHHLRFTLASLGITLHHAKPYTPQGKGKIERFFKTVRSGFLSGEVAQDLKKLNEQFLVWLQDRYHTAVHSSTAQTPLNRFTKNIQLIRMAPENLDDHFRTAVMRTVSNDRVVHLRGNLYEAPIDLIRERIEILFNPEDLSNIEARFKGKSYGFLKLLDTGVNVKIRRQKSEGEMELESRQTEDELQPYQDGQLFSGVSEVKDINAELF